MIEDPGKRRLWHIFRGCLAIVLVAGPCWLLHMSTATTGFLLLFCIVLISQDTDFLSASILSLAAALTLDYFFATPLFSLRINNPEELLTLGLFLVTALVVTKLGASARDQAAIAQRRRQETEQIYRITERLLQRMPSLGSHNGLTEPFLEVLGLRCVCLYESGPAKLHQCGESKMNLGERTRDAYLRDKDIDEPGTGVYLRCLRLGGVREGAIGFEGLRNGRVIANPLAALAGSTLQRLRAYEKANDAAAQARVDSLRTVILDALAHEFKTPLATILSAAGGLQEVGELSEEQTELAQMVETEASRLGNLTSRLLKTVHLDREEVHPNRRPADLGDLLDLVLSRQGDLWPDNEFDVKLSEGEVDILADSELILLVLNQLIDNACKYAERGGRVEVEMRHDGATASVAVWSASAPIESAERSRVFERFYRGDTVKENTAGTGLGLYVARKIALAHDGNLVLDEAKVERGGNSFRLILPIAQRNSHNER